MAHPNIRTFPDAALRLPSREVPEEHFDELLRTLAQQMVDLAVHLRAGGLAANQVGHLTRMVVIREQDPPDSTRCMVMVNPVIESRSEETTTLPEGCLSLPGIVLAEITRAQEIAVSYRQVGGEPVSLTLAGTEARVVQHEVDHLDGVTILDHVSKIARRIAVLALTPPPDMIVKRQSVGPSSLIVAEKQIAVPTIRQGRPG